MELKYVIAKQVFGFDETKKARFVPKQVITGHVTFSKLCTQVGQICGTYRGTVQLIIAGLVDALVNNIDDGKSVQLGEFRIFRPAIRAKTVDKEEDADSSKIYRHRIVFTPGSALKQAMNNTSITHYAVPDRDYTDGTRGNSGNNPGGGDNGDDEFIEDPTA